MESPRDIRVRFNTKYKSSEETPNELPWRILTLIGDHFQEEAASEFNFHGVCYSTKEIIPDVGEKHHVGCFGKVIWEGAIANIYSYDQF